MQQIIVESFLQRYLVPSLERVLGKVFRPGLTSVDGLWADLRAKVAVWLTQEFVYAISERFFRLATGSESGRVPILNAVDLAVRHFDSLRKLDVPHGLFSIPIADAKTAAMLPLERKRLKEDEESFEEDEDHDASTGAVRAEDSQAAANISPAESSSGWGWGSLSASSDAAAEVAQEVAAAAEPEDQDEDAEDEDQDEEDSAVEQGGEEEQTAGPVVLKSVRLGRLEGARARAKQGKKMLPFLMRAWEEGAEVEEVGEVGSGLIYFTGIVVVEFPLKNVRAAKPEARNTTHVSLVISGCCVHHIQFHKHNLDLMEQ